MVASGAATVEVAAVEEAAAIEAIMAAVEDEEAVTVDAETMAVVDEEVIAETMAAVADEAVVTVEVIAEATGAASAALEETDEAAGVEAVVLLVVMSLPARQWLSSKSSTPL